jgi:hypothetical protein
MSIERQQMRSTLAWTAGLIGWVLFLAAVAAAVGWRRSLQRRIGDLERRVSAQAEVFAVQAEALKRYDEKLRAFSAIADGQFPHAPPAARLGLLHANLVAVIDAEKHLRRRRCLDAESVNVIRPMMKEAPVMNVEIGTVEGDADSLALAEQFKSLFLDAGFHVRKLVHYDTPQIRLPGLSIYTRPRFDETMGPVIAEIFKAVSQPRIQWINRESAGISDS